MDTLIGLAVLIVVVVAVLWVVGFVRAARREPVNNRLRAYCNHE